MLRQALSISINELRKIANELEKEDNNSEFPINDTNIKWSLVIINKTPKCSDTWEFEK